MKRRRPICMLMVFIVILSSLFFLVVCTAKEEQETIKKETAEETEVQQKKLSPVMSAEETIRAFTDLIYTYDTSERRFYEGTDAYMTESAYERMVPMQSEEVAMGIRSMSSELLDITTYYRIEDEKHLSVLAEVWYRLSSSGEFRCRQLIKLQLIKADKWVINDYTVLDTMEE